MQPLPHTRWCFACGVSNPIGLKLDLMTDGRKVWTRFMPGPEHVGFRATVHGGILSTLLDEVMVWACAVQSRRLAYCAELNVRFLQPAQPGEELTVTGWLANNRRNKLFAAEAELRNPGQNVLATATGKYLPIKPAQVPGLLEDFVENVQAVLGPDLGQPPPE